MSVHAPQASSRSSPPSPRSTSSTWRRVAAAWIGKRAGRRVRPVSRSSAPRTAGRSAGSSVRQRSRLLAHRRARGVVVPHGGCLRPRRVYGRESGPRFPVRDSPSWRTARSRAFQSGVSTAGRRGPRVLRHRGIGARYLKGRGAEAGASVARTTNEYDNGTGGRRQGL